jgi:hypothetical protein
MSLTIIHDDIKERIHEMFVAIEREAYANGFDLRHYHKAALKKQFLASFKIHEYTEDEYLEKIGNSAWVYNYIVHRANVGIDVPTVFQHYAYLYAEEMYDTWFNQFLCDTYV